MQDSDAVSFLLHEVYYLISDILSTKCMQRIIPRYEVPIYYIRILYPTVNSSQRKVQPFGYASYDCGYKY